MKVELALRLRARHLHPLDRALLDLAPVYSMIC